PPCASVTCSAHRPDLHSFPTRRSSDLRKTTAKHEQNGSSERLFSISDFAPVDDLLCVFNANLEFIQLKTLRYIQSSSVPSICSRSEEHTSELQSRFDLVCPLLPEKKNG